MNPLTRALTLAEDPPEVAARTADKSSGPAIRDRGRLGSIRATRDEPVPETLSPAALAGGDALGRETPGDTRLAPIRATRDGADPETWPPAGFTTVDAADPRAPGETRPAPLRATREVAIADAAVPGDDSSAPETPAPTPAALARSPSDPAGAAASDEAATRAVDRRDFRSLRRGRGVGRGIGIALSLLAVTGAAAGGGTFLWKTELARPVLVGSLPPLPPAVVVPTPVHAANATGGGTTEPAGNGAVPLEGSPAINAATPGSGSPQTLLAAVPGSERHSAPPEAAPKNEAPSILPAAPTNSRHPFPSAAASGSDRLPALQAVALENESQPVLPAVPRNEEVPAPSTASRDEGHPNGLTAESAAPMPESSSSGLRAPGASEETRRIGTEHTAPAAERRDAEPPPDAGDRIAIRKRKRPDHVATSLERAYAAYLAGDVESAGQAYRTVLGHEPRNRDARLGLAAVAARAGRWAEAADHYATLLATHPADTAARAALIAIAEKDPARAESRLKGLLRVEPEAAHLHFSLGSLYASQSRWPEAQQSWFSAYRLDRGNADHAYNLAVSLDHMSQPRSALGLYREALLLARSSPAGFEAEAVRRRIRALESHPDAGRPLHGPPRGTAAAGTEHVR